MFSEWGSYGLAISRFSDHLAERLEDRRDGCRQKRGIPEASWIPAAQPLLCGRRRARPRTDTAD